MEKLRNMIVSFVALVSLWTVLLAPRLWADSLSFAVSDQRSQPRAGGVSLWHPRMAQPLTLRMDSDTGARDTVALALTITEPRNTFEDVLRRAD